MGMFYQSSHRNALNFYLDGTPRNEVALSEKAAFL
jgi:hypothetical protein